MQHLLTSLLIPLGEASNDIPRQVSCVQVSSNQWSTKVDELKRLQAMSRLPPRSYRLQHFQRSRFRKLLREFGPASQSPRPPPERHCRIRISRSSMCSFSMTARTGVTSTFTDHILQTYPVIPTPAPPSHSWIPSSNKRCSKA